MIKGLNPYSNGMRSELCSLIERSMSEAVLILILMECARNRKSEILNAITVGLNPCSNGMRSEHEEITLELIWREVLILILMECARNTFNGPGKSSNFVLILILMECARNSTRLRLHVIIVMS